MTGDDNPKPSDPLTVDPSTAARSSLSPVDAIAAQVLESSVVEVLRTVFDPEVPVNIYDMGLIYEVAVEPGGKVGIRMTLTSPMCPVAETLPPEVETKVRAMEGVAEAKVEVVWEPPWTPERMSEAARLQLNL